MDLVIHGLNHTDVDPHIRGCKLVYEYVLWRTMADSPAGGERWDRHPGNADIQ